jgi:hypothetical protein
VDNRHFHQRALKILAPYQYLQIPSGQIKRDISGHQMKKDKYKILRKTEISFAKY